MSTTAWLDPVRAALDALGARGETRPVFFRDDDGGWDDDALTRLLDRFETAGVPIDVAVIPDAIRASTAQALARRAGRGLLHLHQHGLAHTNHEPEGRSWEFGPSRSTAEQYADIERGRRRLDELLGPASEPIFTPPWNRCGPDSGDHLAAAGIAVLSRDATAPALGHAQVREVRIDVDWFGKARGERWTRGEARPAAPGGGRGARSPRRDAAPRRHLGGRSRGHRRARPARRGAARRAAAAAARDARGLTHARRRYALRGFRFPEICRSMLAGTPWGGVERRERTAAMASATRGATSRRSIGNGVRVALESGLISVLLLVVVAGVALFAIRMLTDAQARVGAFVPATRNAVLVDMMHDGLRADVLGSRLTTTDEERQQSLADIDEHGALMRTSMAAVLDEALSDETRAAQAAAATGLDRYIEARSRGRVVGRPGRARGVQRPVRRARGAGSARSASPSSGTPSPWSPTATPPPASRSSRSSSRPASRCSSASTRPAR